VEVVAHHRVEPGSGHVQERPVVDETHVHVARDAAVQGDEGGRGVERDAQGAGQAVARSDGHQAQRHPRPDQAPGHLVGRAVAAHGENEVVALVGRVLRQRETFLVRYRGFRDHVKALRSRARNSRAESANNRRFVDESRSVMESMSAPGSASPSGKG